MPKATELTVETLGEPVPTPTAALPPRAPRVAAQPKQKAPGDELTPLQAKVRAEIHLAMKVEALKRSQNLGEFLTDCFNSHMGQNQ